MFGSDKGGNSFSIKKLLFICTTLLMILSIFIPASWYKANMVRELKMGEVMTGQKSFNGTILPYANALYTDYFVKTGINDVLKTYFNPAQKSEDKLENTFNNISNVFLPFFKNITTVICYHLYMVTYRLSVLSFWIPFFFIMLVPSVIAGLCQWKRKQYDFSYVSPFLNRRSIKLVGYCVFLMVLSIIIPLPVPPVINAIMALFVVPMAIILIISNLPKQI
ncbi:DUF4400 domain-containing protein [Xenorhabdus sp. TH1]|uniref:DUF4400 domain-containing protein n=1 Tax=Xenorhabdus sp. TH1 TaxID=3130166 RepID=UPI0030D10D1C